MSIQPGTKLGPYEITSPLGAGGMGEVYRAHDPRFGRDVAVKVLPSSFASNSDRMQRFEQEARAAGVLNHPNILSVYDVGTTEGAPYLVAELLEGETLRTKLTVGALAQRKAIDYGLQCARGLSAAHEKGIIHRDLKPENLFITKDGRLKILDFGLAKLTQLDAESGKVTQLPTTPGTEPGVVLGTMGYMSPEQVRGKSADHRSDIFSFGTILYEMLSGTKAFGGESSADTLSAILHKDPPELSQTNRNIPPALSRIVQHCLEKDVEQRFHSASDIAFDLESLSGSTDQTTTAPAVQRHRQIPPYIWKAISAILLIVAAFFGFLYYRSTSQPSASLHASLEFPTKWSFGPGQSNGMAISPNGKYVAYTAFSEGKFAIWIRPVERFDSQFLATGDGISFPFWSPDGESVAFFADGKLKRIKRTGGAIQTICDAPVGRGGTWNQDGTIVFAPQPYGGLYRVLASGGTATPVTKVSASDRKISHRWPSFFPDGKHFVFTSMEPDGIYVGSLDSFETKKIAPDASNAQYFKKGYLLFVREANVVAQPFRISDMNLSGEAFPVVQEKIFYEAIRGQGQFSISNEGSIVYRSAVTPTWQPVWLDRSGKVLASFGEVMNYFAVRISPDGNRVSIARQDFQSGATDLWVYEIATNRYRRLTYNETFNGPGIWSPDQSQLIISKGTRLFLIQTSGGPEQLIFESTQTLSTQDFSKDGRFIVFQLQTARGDWDLWMLRLSDRKAYPFVETNFDDMFGAFSPDGNWVSFSSGPGTQPEIYVRSFSDPQKQWQISTDGGLFSIWRNDGKELLYFRQHKVFSVDVQLGSDGSQPSFGTPKLLFTAPDSMSFGTFAPDGQRFLFLQRPASASQDVLRLITSWPAALKD